MPPTRPLLLLSAALIAAAPAHARIYTLESYTREVLSRSPEIVQAKASLKKTSADYDSTRFNAVLPKYGVTWSGTPYGHSSNNSDSFNRWKMSDKDTTLTTTISLNLFNSFRDYFGVKSARLSEDAANRSLETVMRSRSLASIRTFYDLSLKRKLLEVAQQDFTARSEQFLLTESLYKSGMKSLPDLLKSETDKLSSELRLAAAHSQNKESLLDFNALLNDPSWEDVTLQTDLALGTTALPRIRRGLQSAVVHRPEVRKARAELEKTAVSLALARHDLFPDFSIDFNLTNRDLGPHTAIDPNPNYKVGLTLSLPSNFNVVSQVYKFFSAKQENHRAASALDGSVRDVRKDVHSAYTDLEQSNVSYRVSRRKAEISQHNLELVKEQYRQGSADVIRLSQAQIDYLNARVESARALHETFINRAVYRHAVGESLW